MFHFDINLGQVIITSMVGLLGYGLRQTYALLSRHLARFDRHEEVLDSHTAILTRMGWRPDESIWFNKNISAALRTRATDTASASDRTGLSNKS